MANGSFSAGRSLNFSDAWLAAQTGTIDIKTLHTNNFIPQGIYINSSSDATEDGNGYCTINGYLFGESPTSVQTWKVPVRTPVALAFRGIAASGTTGRGIKLISEN